MVRQWSTNTTQNTAIIPNGSVRHVAETFIVKVSKPPVSAPCHLSRLQYFETSRTEYFFGLYYIVNMTEKLGGKEGGQERRPLNEREVQNKFEELLAGVHLRSKQS